MIRMTSPVRALGACALLVSAVACGGSSSGGGAAPAPARAMAKVRPSPDPRVGLKAGLFDAATAEWNMKLVSTTPPPENFKGVTNSDLAFTGKYAIQGNYNGWQIWDISNPAQPRLETAFLCPASQSDVSVYGNLLFISGEGTSGRLDCGAQGVQDTVSKDRLRGLRIFDITDIRNPKNVGNVQTCRGSHTHSVLVDPKDRANVYVYISGSAGVRSPSELPGCSNSYPDEDPNSALFRIEVIRVPLADPSKSAIVSSPRIFNDLTPPPAHGETAADRDARERTLAEAKQRGAFVIEMQGRQMVLPDQFANRLVDSVAKARGATTPNGADSAAVRAALPDMMARMFGGGRPGQRRRTGPTQCHDITLYPAIGLAGGACEGYGLLLDISDPVNPKRLSAVSDSNFSYWHSATFSNDGSKILFTDEWGGGGQAKCRVTDPKEWGANAIFTRSGSTMQFQSYYKLPAPQTAQENCVAHNGSLIPIPGRDVMVQSWYQGGISVFDWTDAAHPEEIAFFDRGPVDATRMGSGGTWSVYWYNGVIVSSEIGRGLDILELKPSAWVSQNEIDAAKTVKFTYLNVQGQQKIEWPASFALARAYADQLERSQGLSSSRLAAVRSALQAAEQASGAARKSALATLAGSLAGDAAGSKDQAKVQMLAKAVNDLASMS
ncbi:MAG: hypothetical protein IPK12_20040 [Gemmatimonadetes bacterium]|nr:hypothetical protein [Gemmatimonadota bacterium]